MWTKLPDLLLDYCYTIWRCLTTDEIWIFPWACSFFSEGRGKVIERPRPKADGAPQPGDDPVTRLAKSVKNKFVVSLICVAIILMFLWGMVFVLLVNFIALNWVITVPSKLFGINGAVLLVAFADAELKSLVKSIPVYFNRPEGKIGILTGSIMLVLFARKHFIRRAKRRAAHDNEDKQNTSTNNAEKERK